jgi:shikimate kinase
MKMHEAPRAQDHQQLPVDVAGRSLALTGFMGVGKSSVGRILAHRLGRQFFDSDDLVRRELGAGPEALFAAGREADFRRGEAAVVARVVRSGQHVLALGGGALLDPDTRALLLREAFLVHLEVPWTELHPVLTALRPGRPLLAGRSDAEIHRLYLDRLAVYRTAHLSVVIGRDSPERAADEVLAALRAMGGGASRGEQT